MIKLKNILSEKKDLHQVHIDKIAGKDRITKVCVNDCLVEEGHAVEYDGGKRKSL